jgi:hypothetical protein
MMLKGLRSDQLIGLFAGGILTGVAGTGATASQQGE